MGSKKKNMKKDGIEIATSFLINPYLRRKILQTAEEMEEALKQKKSNPKTGEPA